jgi:hypothetical protein
MENLALVLKALGARAGCATTADPTAKHATAAKSQR